MDRAELEAIVRETVREVLGQGAAAAAPEAQGAGAGIDEKAAGRSGGESAARRVRLPPPRDPEALRRLIEQTPARVAQGRTGTRYLTEVYVGLRAEHAIARDAVYSEVPDGFPEKLGCLSLRTRAKDKEEYLLYPDHGRRLDDESRRRVEAEASRGADVQVILADGLAAWAIARQGEELLPALLAELQGKGLSTGKPLFVRFARIGVQDEIGVLTQARSTLIAVGERPGLGTGDSLSIYTAYGPRLGQDNAEKNCISNIRPLGLPPRAAARECAELMRRTFDAGGGGIQLARAQRDGSAR